VDGSSAQFKRMVQWRDSMMMRQAKLVTFVISLMTDITNGVAKPSTLDRCARWSRVTRYLEFGYDDAVQRACC
jgi:hypothetical protein